MSSTSNVLAAAPPSAANTRSSLTTSQVLQIPAASPYPYGTWYRVPEPLVIRYRGEAGAAPVTDYAKQQEVVKAIGGRIGSLVPKPSRQLPHIGMGTVFDQEAVYPDLYPILDIVCSTPESCDAIRQGLREIQIGTQSDRPTTFKQFSWSDALPDDVLPFDIYEQRVKPNEIAIYVTHLEQMAAKLGTLVGPVRAMVTTFNWQEPNEVFHVLRGYIKLSPVTLQLGRDERVKRQEYFFRNSSRIMYSDRHLKDYKEWALQYPDHAAKIEGREEMSASSEEACNEANASSEASSKKKKSAK